MKWIFLSLLLCSLQVQAKRAPAHWRTSTNYEKKPNSEVNRSVLNFEHNGAKSTYKPEEAPFGLVETERIPLNGKEYFVTIWPNGARSVLVRVFEPEKQGAQPICEIVSFAESANLKLSTEGVLELETYFDNSDQPKWLPCDSKSGKDSKN